MRPIKNKKRIDPRYFMDEKVDKEKADIDDDGELAPWEKARAKAAFGEESDDDNEEDTVEEGSEPALDNEDQMMAAMGEELFGESEIEEGFGEPLNKPLRKQDLNKDLRKQDLNKDLKPGSGAGGDGKSRPGHEASRERRRPYYEGEGKEEKCPKCGKVHEGHCGMHEEKEKTYPAAGKMKKLVRQAKLKSRYEPKDDEQLKKDYDKHGRGTLRDPKHSDAHK